MNGIVKRFISHCNHCARLSVKTRFSVVSSFSEESLLKRHYSSLSVNTLKLADSRVDKGEIFTMLKSISDNISKLSLSRKASGDASSEKTLPVPLHDVDIPFEKATFGMGCFWSCDSLYGAEKGVLRTVVGYSGGTKKDPLYRNLLVKALNYLFHRGDHTEAIEIHFDPTVVSYQRLLDLFWNNHEYGLTTKIKKQYASRIFYHSEEQKRIAEESRVTEQKIRSNETIITTVEPASHFYPAEDYHQKYRLQAHKKLASELGLGPSESKLLQTSHLAAKLNGYLVGVGGSKQFTEEAPKLGLNDRQIEYVLKYVKENEGGGLTC